MHQSHIMLSRDDHFNLSLHCLELFIICIFHFIDLSYSNIFESTAKGLFFPLISCPICLLQGSRKDTDFCLLILYSDTFIKVIISCRRFLVKLGGFFMSKKYKDTLATSFPSCNLLFSLSCLIAVVKENFKCNGE